MSWVTGRVRGRVGRGGITGSSLGYRLVGDKRSLPSLLPVSSLHPPASVPVTSILRRPFALFM
ncbi:hypothetical protein E2C01_059935 [Portunus trituberculatus]|uniref:Uncharacterized protein n=1 Tax=Portunus trituberculatus TaxID=210409 RepID=A0A5B7H7J8_PORTR|nr:hypothetical protein [Portunus trituberculatus]